MLGAFAWHLLKQMKDKHQAITNKEMDETLCM